MGPKCTYDFLMIKVDIDRGGFTLLWVYFTFSYFYLISFKFWFKNDRF